MSHRVRVIMSVGPMLDLEATPALRTNLLNMARGVVLPTDFLQVHDDEYVNIKHIVSFEFYEEADDVLDESGGHVFDEAKTDESWRPDQHGGVVTAEPDVVTYARERGEKSQPDSGDM